MDELYLDHAATTPLLPEVLDAMRPWLSPDVGNPSSIHRRGRRAREGLEDARARVARALGVEPAEVVFTSGGTESNDLAVLGYGRRLRARGRHVLSQPTEHPSVLAALDRLAREGHEVELVPVDASGRVDPAAVARAARADTVLVALMHANNETGVIQPVADVARALSERGLAPHLHVDAVQTAGWLDARRRALGAGSIAVTAHKLGGPVGVGALALATGSDPEPLLVGGRQERGLRAGTEPVALAVGLAAALERAAAGREARSARVAAARDELERAILAATPGARVNGASAPRLPGHLSLSFDGVSGEAIVASLDLEGIAASSGSACATGAPGPSHVLVAMGLAPGEARGSLRLSLGEPLSIERVAGAVAAAVLRARAVARS